MNTIEDSISSISEDVNNIEDAIGSLSEEMSDVSERTPFVVNENNELCMEAE